MAARRNASAAGSRDSRLDAERDENRVASQRAARRRLVVPAGRIDRAADRPCPSTWAERSRAGGGGRGALHVQEYGGAGRRRLRRGPSLARRRGARLVEVGAYTYRRPSPLARDFVIARVLPTHSDALHVDGRRSRRSSSMHPKKAEMLKRLEETSHVID